MAHEFGSLIVAAHVHKVLEGKDLAKEELGLPAEFVADVVAEETRKVRLVSDFASEIEWGAGGAKEDTGPTICSSIRELCPSFIFELSVSPGIP